MNVLAINCTNCGAPLEFSARAQTVRCRYCSSLMLVKRAGATASLDLIERGVSFDPVIPADERTVQLREEMHELDRKWLREREGYLRSLNQQAFRMVGTSDFMTLGVIAIVVLVTCSIAVWFAGMNGFVFMAVFGVVPVGFFIARGGLSMIDSAGYICRSVEYTRARERLVDQIRGRIAVHGIDAEEVDLTPASGGTTVKGQ